MDKYEEESLKLIDSDTKLSEDELEELLIYEVDRITGENGRWSRCVGSILHIGDRYFELNWEEGLTEYQDNMFDSQPEEVIPVERTKTVKYTEYVPIGKCK